MGDILPNHAYVDLTTVEEDIGDPGDTVRCHSDLSTCCSINEGDHRGSWFFPDGTELPFTSTSDDIVMDREPQEVHIRRRNNVMSPSGIYRCDIETVPVNDNDVATITGETVYVGLYPSNEGICTEWLYVHRYFITKFLSYNVTSSMDICNVHTLGSRRNS